MSPLSIISREQTRKGYYVQTGAMYDNPWGVPLAEIQAMEATLPEETVAQAIYGMYVENSGLVFHSRQLTNLFSDEDIFCRDKWVHPDLPNLVGPLVDPYDTGRAHRPFKAAADLARTNDYTVIMVFDCSGAPLRPAQLVYYYRLNRVSWESIYAEIAKVAVWFRCPVMLDTTGIGDVVFDEMDGRIYCANCHTTVPMSLTGGTKLCPKCDKEGFRYQLDSLNFAGKRKANAVTRLQQALAYGEKSKPEWGLFRMPRIDQVAKELTFYRLDDAKLETDTVMTMAMVAQQLEFDSGDSAIGSIHG